MSELEAAVAAARVPAGGADDEDPRLEEAQATARAALSRVAEMETRLGELEAAHDAAAAERDRAEAAREAARAERDAAAAEAEALKAEVEALKAARAEDAAMIEEALAELRDVV
ncbi:hypothetical protein P2H44_06075 [Albimonas sp. CAU 1670]|uniref:hypothetical protein n=1 Tax=Albimonas sp. CAU 1670 TaxID=3032599 RepID=UPI0023DA9C2E|nr:hypothetical protein [Albimonas sp. CAU 1670]MDF2232116.1 hypothetical protein [Albimonas sp. CAU 1670]